MRYALGYRVRLVGICQQAFFFKGYFHEKDKNSHFFVFFDLYSPPHKIL